MQLLIRKVKIVVIMFCECTGKLFFPLLVGVNFILSGFELITFHLSESRGSGGMLPWENLNFQNLRNAILGHSGGKVCTIIDAVITTL